MVWFTSTDLLKESEEALRSTRVREEVVRLLHQGGQQVADSPSVRRTSGNPTL
jgi:hypothetical protein